VQKKCSLITAENHKKNIKTRRTVKTHHHYLEIPSGRDLAVRMCCFYGVSVLSAEREGDHFIFFLIVKTKQ
jgi:hypothetical protein